MVRRLAYGALLTIGAAVVAALGLAAGSWPPPPATAPGLLGLPLPPGVAEDQVMVERHSFGAYRAYVRFALSPADLPVLLSDPAFQRVPPHGGPLTIFDNAQIGRTPVGEQVLRGRPAWWQPEQASALTLAYRSPPGPDAAYTGPDAAWYLIDTSDTARAASSLAALIKRSRANHQPIIVTQKGYPTGVLLDIELFTALRQLADRHRRPTEGEEQGQ